jgi:excisionase family DNA binding protein
MARQKTPTNIQPHYLSIPEVAILLGLGRTKVYDLIKHEGLPYVQFGDLRRVPLAKLQHWLEQREQQNSA